MLSRQGRIPHAISQQTRNTLLYRGMASLKKIPLTRPTGVNPPLFHQTIVHSDGSTFTLRTTSPRPLLKLTKDARNHPLWNPALNVLDDQSGELAKFERRFGEVADLGDLAEYEVVEAAPKKTKKVVEAEPVQAAKKGKKKK
ncbi:uncharacterized protein SPPG_07363 [Spizellomyces punctatus DAOM BR117]|uniref:Ribosomal protein bL31m N-terminal domain-containing protein n=1 Tax=Spizellomyces punctatus (strain DAOM BR117) TaxID=645134 RepID=A0A0L0H893_SPIPD|nr:uncharacterized protein SPPG_07363 [Spizellomyces punctatus DAOM BR117]KNC97442.1 hypothetical protein SPPG_07363 [Spizellomyces punctatus DAOM BR117]|eukprot:XP_016605482.1 hypothetical protein SPPG_07363 [Spizellomyces punctatus DAOM BR117]